jgi:hypothetical protein
MSSVYRDQKAPLSPEEMADPTLRKNVFRALGRDLSYEIRHGMTTDAPGAIARLMEKAFKAGQEAKLQAVEAAGKASRHRDVTEMDVPSFPRSQLYMLRLVLGLPTEPVEGMPPRDGRNLEATGLILLKKPAVPGFPATVTRDQWLSTGMLRKDGLSNKAVLPLVKMGLLDEPLDLNQGWQVTYITEWGFELLACGRTSSISNRHPGTSTTFKIYRDLLGERPRDLLLKAGREIGIVKDAPDDGAGPGHRR